jgi:hypothetical protein
MNQTGAQSSKAADLNSVISKLEMPNRVVQCAVDYSNERNIATHQAGIQAYAKLAGANWTYYVKTLSIIIGREPDLITSMNTRSNQSNDKDSNDKDSTEGSPSIDLNLGPSKNVSRRHAKIEYSLHERTWECSVLGRNGVKINGQSHRDGQQVDLVSG